MCISIHTHTRRESEKTGTRQTWAEVSLVHWWQIPYRHWTNGFCTQNFKANVFNGLYTHTYIQLGWWFCEVCKIFTLSKLIILCWIMYKSLKKLHNLLRMKRSYIYTYLTKQLKFFLEFLYFKVRPYSIEYYNYLENTLIHVQCS